MDAIRIQYNNTIQWIQTQYGCHMDTIQEIQYIKYTKTFYQNAISFLVQSTTCFLVDSTILRRKYKDQPFNFTTLNSSSMQYFRIT